MNIKFLDLAKEYQDLKTELDSAIFKTLKNSSFVGGKNVEDFEVNFANFLGARGCVGVGNGTDALEIALRALNLPKDSEIILPANSFIASIEAVLNSGYKAVLVDCADDFLIDTDCIKNALTSKTTAILPVHLYGRACNMQKILDIAHENHLKIIEDCAQAHGAKSIINEKLRNVGHIGDIGCFSFYPGKNLGAYGDAGAISSNDIELLEKCRSIANHGVNTKDRYNHRLLGRNSRLDGIQAAILDVKLKYLSTSNQHRRYIAHLYTQKLSEIPYIITPPSPLYEDHCVWHLYTIMIPSTSEKRNQLQEYLQNNGISTGIHYPKSLSQIKAIYENPNCILHPSPKAEQYAQSTLSLPIGNHIEEKEVDYICKVIERFCETN
ncbi:DegT/DnrJ/EryC1/StrS family aminotransferase [Helicobacter cappadocius]|uniref:DegT/DnrJ/EryC1/StrS family aminotransferase n=1 Tax=Helicobacter cappadocius TaxID=3063998 RepID=A0AA90PKD0_9HELI|nr:MULTISPECIES: DegT/DnrJ/EryC1/StrS family aminotransferase [unclassified Helicobacter]MDO7253191.1 DegT/DnrJ/EryC1/StrS family aminotransferase [Helicobacter sp. faydin-H75]MDP2539115.1 DegT/DnrJ/EryC1/StrS family aminotransferase [Helicobacter sp. faydin-H76]